eukprot:449361-Lingulodinium_polyedra.AAC.1
MALFGRHKVLGPGNLRSPNGHGRLNGLTENDRLGNTRLVADIDNGNRGRLLSRLICYSTRLHDIGI